MSRMLKGIFVAYVVAVPAEEGQQGQRYVARREDALAVLNAVGRVQIWCAFAGVNLGEARFSSPVMELVVELRAARRRTRRAARFLA